MHAEYQLDICDESQLKEFIAPVISARRPDIHLPKSELAFAKATK
jgi:hypothetical protein